MRVERVDFDMSRGDFWSCGAAVGFWIIIVVLGFGAFCVRIICGIRACANRLDCLHDCNLAGK